MAQKLIYINKDLNGDGGALEWLQAQSSDIPYTSSSNIYFHSLVFTQDNYLVTHGKIYNGHDTIVDAQAIETLGLLQSTGKINNASLTVYATTTTALPASIFAPVTGGTKGQFLISDGSTNAPVWANLKDILKKTTYGITTNDPSTTNCILKYTSSGLTWSTDTNTTYKLTLNGTTNGASGGTSLGTLYAPAEAGTQYQILQANSSGIPAWVTLTSNLTSTANEDHTIPTSYAVKSYITDAVNGAVTQAMVYKGTVETHTALPTGNNVTNGDVYMFTGSGTYGSGANAKDYKAGDTAIATVSGSTVTWEIVPSGNEQETFITVTTNGTTPVTNYNKATGEVKLGNAALKYYLADNATIAGNTTSTNLVSAKQVKDYVTGLNYSTTVGTVTSITAGRGLDGGTITDSGTIDIKLAGGDATVSGNRAYSVALDGSGNLAVNVPWTDTTHNFYVGATKAKANAAVNAGTDVYLTTKLTSAASSADGTNILGLHQGTGIQISAANTGVITITNSSPNVTTSMLVGLSTSTANAASTNGNTYIRLKEGSSYTNFNIVGAGAASVASDANGKITITGTNTWRPVYAYNLQNQALGSSSPAISGTTGTAALAFGQEFAYTEGDSTLNADNVSEIHLAWAEVAADGTLSYAI